MNKNRILTKISKSMDKYEAKIKSGEAPVGDATSSEE